MSQKVSFFAISDPTLEAEEKFEPNPEEEFSKVEEEDTRNAMMKEIQKYPGQEKQIMDYLKNNPEAQQQLSGPIFEDKIIDFILELANVKEKTVSVDELYKEEEMDLKKEASKAKRSNKSVDKNKTKKTTKKVSKKS